MKSLIAVTLSLMMLTLARAEDPETLAIGAAAPAFRLPATDGKIYSLDDFRSSRILLIVFTCNHCPTAQAYEDRIKRLVVDYKPRGVAVVAISPNDPLSVRLDEMGYTDVGDGFDDMKIRATDKQFNFPYLYDGENSEVSMKYGPQATPHVLIFDQDRKLRYTGRIDDGEKPGTAKNHDTRNALEQLLKGDPVSVEKTKTFGCSIKWPSKRAYAESAVEEWAREKIAIEELSMDQLKTLVANKDGNTYRLINIWATWCGPCVTEFPSFVDMNRMYRNREFELITISFDDLERKATALNFLKRKQASMKNYIINGNRYDFIEVIDKKWQGALPYTIFIAPGGKVLYGKQGLIDPLQLKKIIVEAIGRVY